VLSERQRFLHPYTERYNALFPWQQSASLLLAKNPSQLHFLGFASVALVLSDLVSQFFFLFNLDISLVEEHTPF
jgi:hypothetical protein